VALQCFWFWIAILCGPHARASILPPSSDHRLGARTLGRASMKIIPALSQGTRSCVIIIICAIYKVTLLVYCGNWVGARVCTHALAWKCIDLYSSFFRVEECLLDDWGIIACTALRWLSFTAHTRTSRVTTNDGTAWIRREKKKAIAITFPNTIKFVVARRNGLTLTIFK